ncbi:UNVERIFIED_ORG: hypothetical protein FHU06_5078, partial [Citrobacter freundii]
NERGAYNENEYIDLVMKPNAPIGVSKGHINLVVSPY